MSGARKVISSYRDLIVWQKAMDLVVECYRLTHSLPKHEVYGLASQIQRASVSVPANIAEGHGREHMGDYLRNLSFANGSLMELETHLLIIQRLNYLHADELHSAFALTAEVGRMINGLTKSLKHRSLTPET